MGSTPTVVIMDDISKIRQNFSKGLKDARIRDPDNFRGGEPRHNLNKSDFDTALDEAISRGMTVSEYLKHLNEERI